MPSCAIMDSGSEREGDMMVNTVNRERFIYNMVNLRMKSLYILYIRNLDLARYIGESLKENIGYIMESAYHDDGDYVKSMRRYVHTQHDACKDLIHQCKRFYGAHPLLADTINAIMEVFDDRLYNEYYRTFGEQAIDRMDVNLSDAYTMMSLSILAVVNDVPCRKYSDDQVMIMMMFFMAPYYEHAVSDRDKADDILRVCDEVNPTYDMFVSLFTSGIISMRDKDQFVTIALYTTCPSYHDMTYADICSLLDGTEYNGNHQACMSYDTLRRFLTGDYAPLWEWRTYWHRYPMSYYTSLLDIYDSPSESMNYRMAYALLPYTLLVQQRRKFRYILSGANEYIYHILKYPEIDIFRHAQYGYEHHENSAFSLDDIAQYAGLLRRIGERYITGASRNILFELAISSQNKDIIDSVPFVLKFVNDTYDIINCSNSADIAAIQQFFDTMGAGLPYDFALENLYMACAS